MAGNSEELRGLIVPVVLEADEKSPRIAVHKLTKDFLKELKKGYVEVPASLDFGEANTKELTDKLKEVQTDFAKKWKAMAKEGFFADSDFITKKQKQQLDDFIDSFKKLAKLTDGERANKRSSNTWLKTNKNVGKRERGSLAYLNDYISQYEYEVKKRNKVIIEQQEKQQAKRDARKARKAKQQAEQAAKKARKQVEQESKQEETIQTKLKRKDRRKKEQSNKKSGGYRYTASSRGKYKIKQFVGDVTPLQQDIEEKPIRSDRTRKLRKIAGMKGIKFSDKEIEHIAELYEAYLNEKKLSHEDAIQLDDVIKVLNDKIQEMLLEKTHKLDIKSTHLGDDITLGNTMIDPTTGTDEAMSSSRRGAYSVTYLRQVLLSMKDFYKRFGKINTIQFETLVDMEKYIDKSRKEQKIKGENKNSFTETERAAGLGEATMKLMSKSMNAYLRSGAEEPLKNFFNYIEAIKKYNQKAKGAKGILGTMYSVTGKMLAKEFGLQPFFDIGQGEDDYRKSDADKEKDPLVEQFLTHMFHMMTKQLKKSNYEQTMKELQSYKTAALIDERYGGQPEKSYKYRRNKGVKEIDKLIAQDFPTSNDKSQKLVDKLYKDNDSLKILALAKQEYAKAQKEKEKYTTKDYLKKIDDITDKYVAQLNNELDKTMSVNYAKWMKDQYKINHDIPLTDDTEQENELKEVKKEIQKGNKTNEIIQNNTKDMAKKEDDLHSISKNIEVATKNTDLTEKMDNAADRVDAATEKQLAERHLTIDTENANTGTDSEKGKQEVITAIKNTTKAQPNIPTTDTFKQYTDALRTVLNLGGEDASPIDLLLTSIAANVKKSTVYLTYIADWLMNAPMREIWSAYKKGSQGKSKNKKTDYSANLVYDDDFYNPPKEPPEIPNPPRKRGRPKKYNPKYPSTQVIDPITGMMRTSKVDDMQSVYLKSSNEWVPKLKASNTELIKAMEKEINASLDVANIKKETIKKFRQQQRLDEKQKQRDTYAKQHQKDVERGVRLHEKTQIAVERNRYHRELRQKREAEIEQRTVKRMGQIGDTNVTAAPKGFFGKLQKTLKNALYIGPNASQAATMTPNERAKETARRIEKYGLTKNMDASETGMKATARYFRKLYRGNKGLNENLFQDIQLTKGLGNLNTNKILDDLQKAIEGNMFNAQTGGGLKNLLGPLTFYAGMPSLEKSRAQIEGLNTILSDVRNKTEDIINKVKANEDVLKAMEDAGQIGFDSQGNKLWATPEADKVFTDYENQKDSLKSMLAEVLHIDDVVKRFRNNIPQIIKYLSLVAPELMKDNKILQNLNAGLDKTGKALKFQTRRAEILNYTFRLMARSVGQMIKRWAMMLNPLSLIKKAFQDFASYDVKWQRTMNVIKYNLRRIVKPMMEWIAQQLVNIIGLANALMKSIGKTFGQNWDLFDQSAANTEKMAEDFERINSVTASFDELHDIAGETNSSDPALDLLGDIYTPQWTDLYKTIEDFGEKIGDTLDNIKKLTKGWNFWTWLAIIGGAIIGFKALQWLISLFGKGQNPLQTVAKGFQFLEKAVGWAILISAFALFTSVLKDFIDVVGHMKPDEVKQALRALGMALLELGVAMVALMGFAKLFKTDFLTSLGVAAIVAAFALLILAITDFINAIKGLTSEEVTEGLRFLAGALGMVTLAIAALVLVFTSLVSTGIGIVAILLLGVILAVVGLVIEALADLVESLKGAGEDIKLICEGIAGIVTSIGDAITGVISAYAEAVATIIQAIADGIVTVLTPILEFVDGIIGKIVELASTIVHEVGETIRTIVKTVGNIILRIIESITEAIPKLLKAIVDFCGKIGPAIEKSADSIMRTITKIVNFTVSAVEYLVNLVVDGINKIIEGINSLSQYVNITIPRVPKVSIPRFVPQYATGTNFVPNNGLAYLHKGEAVIPTKYNQGAAYQPQDNKRLEEEIRQLNNEVRQIGNAVYQGISIHGEFKQRGSDLVAVVQKADRKLSNNILNNRTYAR